jgi:hypothetical protein
MLNHNQDGASPAVTISIVGLSLLSIVAIVFSIWAFGGRQDYKNKVETKINAAVTVAVGKQQTIDSAKYAQESQDPLSTFNGPEAYGSIVLQYPKTWSGYLNSSTSANASSGSNGAVVDARFNPNVVPSVQDTSSVFAVTLQVLNQSYAQTLQSISQTQGITSVAYTLPKLPNVVGVEATGQISGDSSPTQTMVILPLRSETIELWTDGTQYLSDFNSVILPNFSFSP